MATHEIEVTPQFPDTSGNVYWEPYSIKATNDKWDYYVLIYADTATRDGCHGRFIVPQNYVGTAKVNVYWTATATTGDVEWDLEYRAVGGDDTESLDQTGNQEALNQNDTAPSAAHERMKATLTLTASNLAVGDIVQFTLFRDGTDAGDTISAAVIVHMVTFEYADA